MTMPSLVTIG